MEALQAEISAKDFDLYNQAEKYIKPKTQDDNIKVAKKIVSNLKKAIKEENINDKIEISLSSHREPNSSRKQQKTF